MDYDEEREIQLQVQCRDGPMRERKCTDWCCCLFYFGLLVAIAVIGFMLYQQPHLTNAQQNALLKNNRAALPFLSTYKAMP